MQLSEVSQLVRGSKILRCRTVNILLPPEGKGSGWLAHVGLGHLLCPINGDLECGQMGPTHCEEHFPMDGCAVSGSSIMVLITDGISPAPSPLTTVLLTILRLFLCTFPFPVVRKEEGSS